MESKIKVLALFGPSGSGKDEVSRWIASHFSNNTLQRIVPCTTRPKREYEINGQDYYFLTHDEFVRKDLNHEMLEVAAFNNWLYGTLESTLSNEYINLGVFNIEGIESLFYHSNIDVLPIFVYCEDKIRLQRALNREEHPNCHEVCRRFLADEIDFQQKNIHFNYITINNSFSIESTIFEFTNNETIQKWINN